MKAILLPAVCVLAMAIMCGAVVSHRLGMAERVAHARLIADQRPPENQPAAEGAGQPAPAPVGDNETVAFLRRIESQVSKMSAQVEQLGKHVDTADRTQQDLRDQVAETNRDLMELQFRVDSHSREFRPLRSVQDSPYANTPGVLPPRDPSP